MAKRVVRALGLIFGCIFTASLVRGFLSNALLKSSKSVLQFMLCSNFPSLCAPNLCACGRDMFFVFWFNCPLLLFSGLYSSYQLD